MSSSVPVLVTPDGGAIGDSRDILRYAHAHAAKQDAGGLTLARGLYPEDPRQREEVERLETAYANGLGVWVRVVVYDFMIANGSMCAATLCEVSGPAPIHVSAEEGIEVTRHAHAVAGYHSFSIGLVPNTVLVSYKAIVVCEHED